MATQQSLTHDLRFAEALLSSSAVGVCFLDCDLRFVAVNDALAAMNGIRVADHIGRTPMELLPDLEPAAFEAMNEVVRTKAPVAGRQVTGWTAADPDRQRTWIQDVEPVFDADGALIGITAVIVEITALWQREQRTRELERIAAELAVAPDSGSVVDIALAATIRALHGSAAALFTVRRGGLLDLAGSVGFDPELASSRHPIPLASLPRIEAAIRSVAVVLLPTAEIVARHSVLADALARAGSYLLVLPLRGTERPMGALIVAFTDCPALDAEDRRWASALARLCAQSLERATLYDRERADRRRAEQTDALRAALAAAGSPEEVGATIIREARRDLGADAIMTGVIDGSADALVADAIDGFDPAVAEGFAVLPLALDVPIVEAARSGEPVFLETNDDWLPRWSIGRDEHVASGFVSAAAVPLGPQARPVGAMVLCYRKPQRFTPDERAFVATFGQICGQALDRAHLAAAADRSRRVLEAVLEQMPVAVGLLEAPGGGHLFANSLLVRMFPELGARKSLSEFHLRAAYRPDGSLYREDEWPAARTVTHGEVVQGEEMRLSDDGGSRWIGVSSAPVTDSDGRQIAAVVVAADITERRRRDAARDAFLGVISHELRTPITSLVAGSRLLRDRAPHSGVEGELVEDLVAESDRLTRIVDDLLVLARSERGVDIRASEPTLLQRVVPSIVETERRRWPSVAFELDLPENLPAVSGDAGYVEHVLGNLMSNAAKYAGASGPVHVDIRPTGEAVEVRVVDRGPGVHAEPIETVFELFFRSAATAAVAPGTGIGLCVARELVEAMGGTIWAANRDGGGAEFGFRLLVAPDGLESE